MYEVLNHIVLKWSYIFKRMMSSVQTFNVRLTDDAAQRSGIDQNHFIL